MITSTTETEQNEMKAFKNELAVKSNESTNVVYIIADVNPNEEYFFECLPQEIEFAVSTGDVYEATKNTFVWNEAA